MQRKLEGFVNIAHRGASGHAPENTVVAARRAIAMGVDYIELDVRRTRDGELVAFHDASLERTTNGAGMLGAHSSGEVQALDAGSWFNRAYPAAADRRFEGTPVATLDDLITAVDGEAGLYIEAKAPESQPGLEQDLVAVLRRHGLLQSPGVVLQAFVPESLSRYAVLAPDVPRVQLLDYGCDSSGALVERRGLLPAPADVTPDDFAAIAGQAAGVAPNASLVPGGEAIIGPDFVAAAHAAGLFVHVYTVDEPALMARLIDAGVDGLFTNFPDRLAALLPP